MELPDFKIRCSAIGKIMVEPRSKADGPLSKGCITFLHSWVNEQLYGRRPDFTSKYTDKGKDAEDEAILYASCHIPEMAMATKNLKRFENEYMTGEPDVITDTHIFDIKSVWSPDTMPIFAPQCPESDYIWQVQGYMALTGKTQGRVVYALISHSDDFIYRESKWKLPQEYTKAEYEKFAAQYKYDDLPPYLRLKEYEVIYSPAKILEIQDRVIECRKYINSNILPALSAQKEKYQ